MMNHSEDCFGCEICREAEDELRNRPDCVICGYGEDVEETSEGFLCKTHRDLVFGKTLIVRARDTGDWTAVEKAAK